MAEKSKTTALEKHLKEGRTHVSKGNLNLALHSFTRAVSADPLSIEAHTYRSYLLNNLGFKELAVEELDFVAVLDPKLAGPKAVKGMLLFESGKHKESLEALDEEIKTFPNSFTGYLSKGVVLFKLGRKEEAIKMLEKAAEIQERELPEPLKELIRGIATGEVAFMPIELLEFMRKSDEPVN